MAADGLVPAPDSSDTIDPRVAAHCHDRQYARGRLARGRARRRVAALEQPSCHLARPEYYILLQGWRGVWQAEGLRLNFRSCGQAEEERERSSQSPAQVPPPRGQGREARPDTVQGVREATKGRVHGTDHVHHV